jgi:transcriptional regulator of acetoin/glycerol metabolism
VASPAGSRALARARLAFLGGQPFDRDAVREPILASWTRSRARSVPLNTGDVPYLAEIDDDTPLNRAAARVLPEVDDALGGEPVSLVLCDGAGTVLRRRTGDRRLERHLDRVFLARGFSYAERHVGTNGIGTSLESGGPSACSGTSTSRRTSSTWPAPPRRCAVREAAGSPAS